MANPIPSLNAKLPENLRGSLARSVKDFFGKPLVFYAAKIAVDENGERAIFTVAEVDKPNRFQIMSFAAQPVSVAKWMIESAACPVKAVFMARGRSTVLIDPSDSPDTTPLDEQTG